MYKEITTEVCDFQLVTKLKDLECKILCQFLTLKDKKAHFIVLIKIL